MDLPDKSQVPYGGPPQPGTGVRARGTARAGGVRIRCSRGGGSLFRAAGGHAASAERSGRGFRIWSSAPRPARLNAVAFAADPTQAGLERLEAVWMSAAPPESRPVLSPDAARLGRSAAGGRALVSKLRAAGPAPQRLRFFPATLGRHIHSGARGGDRTWARAPAVVLSRRGRPGRRCWPRARFPGLYPPVEVDGRLLVDGGVVCPT